MNPYLQNFVAKKYKKPGKALDLGAGKFLDVAGLKHLGWNCQGVDLKTKIDLEQPYLSKQRPFDLVYSNYVLHKLKNPEQLFATAFDNLKKGGWVFLHTFDKSDKNSKSELDLKWLKQALYKQGFAGIQCKVFRFYDNEPGHRHWHKILEVVAKKV